MGFMTVINPISLIEDIVVSDCILNAVGITG